MIFSLLKLEYHNLFASFSGTSRKNKKAKSVNNLVYLLLFLLLGAYLTFASYMFSNNLYNTFSAIGDEALLPTVMFYAVSLTTLFYTIFKSGSVLFIFKDFDLLASLPIKFSEIITAKLIFLYTSNILFQSIVILPAMALWAIKAPITIQGLIYSLIAFLFLPFIPIVIASIIGTMITYISGFFKNSNIFAVILQVIFIFFIFIASFSIGLFGGASSTGSSALFILANGISAFIKKNLFNIYAPSELYYNLVQGDTVSFLLFIGISFVFYYVFCLFVAKNFLKIRAKITATKTTSKKIKITQTSKSAFSSLVSKEFKLLFSLPIYAMNMLTGLVMGIMLFGIVIYFYIAENETFVMVLPLIKVYVLQLIPIVLSFFAGYVSMTSCSLSLEGNSFWLLKSMPISAFSVFLSKIVSNIILHTPFSLAFSFIAIYILKPDLVFSIFIIFIPLSFCVFSSVYAMLLNIRFPMFDWTNPSVPVKKGMAVFIMVFLNMALYFGLGFLVFNVFDTTSKQIMFYTSALVVINSLSGFMLLYLKNQAEKIFLKLQ